LEPLRGRIDRVSAKRPLGLTIRLGDGRDALPRDPRQDLRWLSSGAAPLIVYAFRRVRRRTSTDAFQPCHAGRARVQLPSEAGTPDMTIARADADRAGARPSYGGGGSLLSKITVSSTSWIGAAARSYQQGFAKRPLGLTIRLGDGRDALPRDPRQTSDG
jgi:hypothetical protein